MSSAKNTVSNLEHRVTNTFAITKRTCLQQSSTGRRSTVLEPLIPLAKNYLENQNREIETRLKMEERELEVQNSREERMYKYSEHVLTFEKYKFNHIYWFALIFVVFVLLIA